VDRSSKAPLQKSPQAHQGQDNLYPQRGRGEPRQLGIEDDRKGDRPHQKDIGRIENSNMGDTHLQYLEKKKRLSPQEGSANLEFDEVETISHSSALSRRQT